MCPVTRRVLLLTALTAIGCGEKRVVDPQSEAVGIELVKKVGGRVSQDSGSPPTVDFVSFRDSFAVDDDLIALRRFPNLRALELNGYIRTGTKYLDQSPNLETLDFVATDEAILNLPQLKKLKIVNALSITDAGLAGLKRFLSLEWISAQNNPAITDAGLEHLTKLSHLRTVSLTKTGVTPEGAAKLRKALPNTNVQVR